MIHLIWHIKEEESARNYYLGILFFVIFFILERILSLIYDINNPGDVSGKRESFFYTFGSFFGSIAVTGLMYVIERNIYSKLHYIPTVLSLINSILIIILGEINGVNLVTYYIIINGIISLIIPILYFKVGLETTGETRMKSFILSFGLLIFLVGIVLNSGELKASIEIIRIISPLVTLVGAIVFQYGLLIYAK
jgi:hypothetical protein